jgi:hypothetical protein
MSGTTTNNKPIPQWMMNIIHPSDSFESEIANKISYYPHYAKPVYNIGGLHVGSYCRIPGIQPFSQPILRPKTCIPHCLTNHCFEYGNTRFPPYCDCNERHDCKSYRKCNRTTLESCKMAGWSDSSCEGNCLPTCSSCNHNFNVIYY